MNLATWELARDEALDLADQLDELTEEQWNSLSLCDQWLARDVLAHITAGAEGAFGLGAIVGGLLRHRFNYDHWIAVDGRTRGQQQPATTLAALRSAAATGRAQPERHAIKDLMHVLIHGQDICRPLGIKRDLPASHVIPTANFVVNDALIFGAKKRIAGLKPTATDMEWSHGDGPEVTGPAEALVMVMAGRLVALDDLSGEGKPRLFDTIRLGA
jgi:uncharacterized protein (TIGR03083 family)